MTTETAFEIVLNDYLRAIEEGGSFDSGAFIAAYPEHEGALREFIAIQKNFKEILDPWRNRLPTRLPSGDSTPLEYEVTTDRFHGLRLPSEGSLGQPSSSKQASEASSRFPEIEGYDILEILGRGGMGIVFKARHRALNRIVALKTICLQKNDEEGPNDRFLREAEVAARLQHPNIVQIFEVVEGESPFLSLEYVDGPTLSKYIASTPQPPRVSAELIETLARAMHYAHQQGILHRDLKPANILMKRLNPEAEGRMDSYVPKIADFGLAKILDERASETKTGAILGTPSYMSPEQASGIKDSNKPAVDIYSLGAILYEMITGRPPFRASSVLDLLILVRKSDPASISLIQPGVPRDLETICLKCLEKDPLRRYQTAEALANDIRRFLNHEPIQARPATRMQLLVKWARRRPTTAALLSVSFFSAFAIAAIALWYAGQLSEALDKTQNAERSTRQKAKEVQSRMYAADVGLSSQFWRTGNLKELLNHLAHHQPQPGDEDLRGFEWRYLAHASQRDHLVCLRDNGIPFDCLALSANDKLLGTAGEDGVIRIFDPVKGTLFNRFGHHSQAVSILRFSTDSSHILSVDREGAVYKWNLTDGRLESTAASPQPNNVCLALSTNCEQIVLAAPDGSIGIFEILLGKRLTVLSDNNPPASAMLLTEDSRTLFTGDEDGVLRSWDIATGKMSVLWIGKYPITALATIAGTARVATGDKKGTVRIHSSTSGQVFEQFSQHLGPVRSLAYSPDRLQLASAGDDGVIHFSLGLSPVVHASCKGHTSSIDGILYFKDSNRIASASRDGTVKIWQADRSPHHTELTAKLHATGPIVIAPNGKIAAIPNERCVQIIDLDSLEATASIPGQVTPFADLGFSPDGNWLAISGQGTGEVWLWNTTTWRPEIKLPIGESFLARVAFSPNGRWLAGCFRDSQLFLWDLENRGAKYSLEGHTKPITGLAFIPDSSRLITAGMDKTVRTWDLSTKKEIHIIEHTHPVKDIAVSPDGRELALFDEEYRLKYFPLPRASTAAISPINQTPYMGSLSGRSLAYSPDGKSLIAIPWTAGSMHIYDSATKAHRKSIATNQEGLQWAAWSPDGRQLATAGVDGSLRVLDTKTWVIRHSVDQINGKIRSLGFTAEGNQLVSLFEVPTTTITHRELWKTKQLSIPTADSAVKIWNLDTNRKVPSGSKMPRIMPLNAMALCPNSSKLIVGGAGDSLWEYDRSTGLSEPIRFIEADRRNDWPFWLEYPSLYYPEYKGSICSVAYSTDGKLLAVATSNGGVKLWDRTIWHERASLPGSHSAVNFVCFSPDNRSLIFNGQGQLKIWDIEPGSQRSIDVSSKPLHCGCFSSDGKMFAVATEDWQIKLWKVKDGFQEAATLVGHSDPITCLIFSPDDRTLASSSLDGTIRLWHPGTSQHLLTLEDHHGPVRTLAFSPDGTVLASGAEIGDNKSEIFLWHAPYGVKIE